MMSLINMAYDDSSSDESSDDGTATAKAVPAQPQRKAGWGASHSKPVTCGNLTDFPPLVAVRPPPGLRRCVISFQKEMSEHGKSDTDSTSGGEQNESESDSGMDSP